VRHHNDELLLHHFTAPEFASNDHGRADWWADMDPAFLVRLDVFRAMWGAPITVSGHPRALGRHLGPGSHSDHNIDVRGTVQCADVFPGGMTSQADAERARDLARAVGLSSIGLYPHWSQPGLHLGIRKGFGGNRPMATWGAVNRGGKQVYVSWGEALKELQEA
jgi:hypothetical protein